ncbi:MAG: DAK2 domain-containing protein [Anaerolineales bacterium]|nr:DAK2 domain-containing protein [Anaerolineales bacterium]
MTEVKTATIPPASEKWLTCDGQQFKQLIQAGLYWLEQHQQEVNALNVFPVPDGDTGTNMLLTMQSAWKRIANHQSAEAGEVAQELSQGALMGARGNSGVILSQIWRGVAASLKDKETFTAVDLGLALQEAAETAYSGVMKPVEGTILTVVREGAEEAVDASQKSQDIRFVLRRTLTRSQQALARTPEQLPILKQAGVVDSGGQGLVYVLEGMYKQSLGEFELRETSPNGTTRAVASAADAPAQAKAAPEDGHIEHHYDVQFILLGEALDVLKVRETIDAMGDSTVVVGDEKMIKVHVHVDDPGVPLSYGISLGEITDVVVENMQMQMDEIIATAVSTSSSPVPLVPVPPPTLKENQIGIVAVAPGMGIANVLRDMGVASVVHGGQTNNPSTEEIYAAVEALPTSQVIILPNNKNILLASEAARDLSEKEVLVLPTRTPMQGISAMLAYQADGDLAEVAEAMQEAASEVATLEITRATRTVELNGVAVAEGNIIGLKDGQLCVAGQDVTAVLQNLLARLDDLDEREVVTLFYGQDVSAGEAENTAVAIQTQYPS